MSARSGGGNDAIDVRESVGEPRTAYGELRRADDARYPAGVDGEMRPFMDRPRPEHRAGVGQCRSRQALHPGLVEIVGDQPALAMHPGVAALLRFGGRHRQGVGRDERGEEGPRVTSDRADVVTDRDNGRRVAALERSAERAHALGMLRVPDDAAALGHEERRNVASEPFREIAERAVRSGLPRRPVDVDRLLRGRGPRIDEAARLALERLRHEQTGPGMARCGLVASGGASVS